MKSYTQLRTDYGNDTKDSSSANLTYGDGKMNDFHRRLLTKADWPFLHQVRTISSLAPSSAVTADAGTDILTATSTVLTTTGTRVQFSSTDTLPTGLSANTDYWLIFQSTTTFKVASSLANALAGTAIDITAAGSGTHTMTVQERFQPLPYDMDVVESVAVIVSGITHTPKPLSSKAQWNRLNYSAVTSDIPEYWYTEDGKISFYPRQASAGNRIELTGRIRVPDLNVADYTTGTVDIITNGSTKVTGSGTSWTTPMVGRWIRVTHSNTAASSGDGEWYRITAVESSTILYIDRPYGGRSLTTGAGAAFTIGQMPLLPEAFHDLPEIYGAYAYWSKEKDAERVTFFKGLLNEGVADLFAAYSMGDLSLVLDDGMEREPINPNLTISL